VGVNNNDINLVNVVTLGLMIVVLLLIALGIPK